jgi:hypothetical protein
MDDLQGCQSTMHVLSDGTYEAFVIDIAPDNEDTDEHHARIDLTILSGDHKGEVVTVRASTIDGDDISVLGLPATLTVIDGAPNVSIHRD